MNRNSPRMVALTLIALASVLVLADVAWACPNCKDSLTHNDPTASGMVQGYFWSIMLMLSMPFLLLTSLGTYFYLLVRRSRRQSPTDAFSPEVIAMNSNLPRWNPATMQS